LHDQGQRVDREIDGREERGLGAAVAAEAAADDPGLLEIQEG
jgi:hypothetical protein